MKNLTPRAICTKTLVVLAVTVATVRSYMMLAMATRVLPQHDA